MPRDASVKRGHGRRRAASTAVAVLVAAACLCARPASAAPQADAKSLYLAAQAREKTIRAALDASPPEPPPTRDAMRQAVAQPVDSSPRRSSDFRAAAVNAGVVPLDNCALG